MKTKGEQIYLCASRIFFFKGGMTFITNMPILLHLRQLANVIFLAVMDGTGVYEVHLAGLEHEPNLFLRAFSLVFGDGDITLER